MPNSIDLRLWLLTRLDECAHLATIHKVALAIAFAAFVACTLSAWRTRQPSASCLGRFLVSDFGFAVLLTALILAGRWPGLLAPELNVDESFFLAGAQKLQRDMVYWRAVDLGTSGPLNVYPLLLPALFGFNLEFAGARCLGLLLVVVSCLSLYAALLQLYGARVARLAVVPVATTFALMTANDYVHYSSEHVPMAIISVAICLACRLATSNTKLRNTVLVLIGLLLGAAPYAKLQATPVAAAIGCICLHIIWSRRSAIRQAVAGTLSIVCGSALFSVVHLGFVMANGVQETFLKSYVLQNLYYSNFSTRIIEKAGNFVHVAMHERDSRALFVLTAALLIAGGPVLIGLRRKTSAGGAEGEIPPPAKDTFVFLFYTLALLAASIYAVAQPQRPFYHYALLLIVPCGLTLGVVLGELQRIAVWSPAPATITSRLVSRLAPLAAAVCIVFSVLQLGSSLRRNNPFIDGRHAFLANYVSPVARAILENASPGDSMAIWGWSPKLHVETGVVQATSDSIPVWQSRPNPQQAFFVNRFVEELRDSNARLFVDTQVPGNLLYQWRGIRGQTFEEVPEIADIVSRNFTVVSRVDGATIYVRK